MLLGIKLRLLIGQVKPVPVPGTLAEALVGVEVTLADTGRSGFQLSFQTGRSGAADLTDYTLLANPLLRPFNRVILVVTFNGAESVLMDGFITTTQLAPSEQPGASTFTVTGEDVSVIMDLEERNATYQGSEDKIAEAILTPTYQRYLASKPDVKPPRNPRSPSLNDPTPAQGSQTDLAYLNELAQQVGHVFYVTPGPEIGQNRAYWGPPERTSGQSALTVNMGPESNVDSINFTFNALAATVVTGTIRDADSDKTQTITAERTSRTPALAVQQAPTALARRRTALLYQRPDASDHGPARRGSMTVPEAQQFAQAKVDAAAEQTVSVSGELDALRYGGLLRPHALVGLRGAGFTFDGKYLVNSVTHTIRAGSYKQRFTLSREGVGSTVARVGVFG
ncbi:phage late control D family protein [Actinomycetospora chibensis]|uniref:Phage late control D family protein n=1 Tax=Actinomycetospora chibensis TaxID=663606 RepID=A0ABV9RLY7_9PSEU|nr:hypothetical protein [Actinomycetospora chibensis]MDD7926961.1 hypothetical protein [Actinomycetospora chibensis]